MKYKTIELDGYRLDGAVAKALRKKFAFTRKLPDNPGPYSCTIFETCEMFSPSSNWQHGGPIIDREGIELWKWTGADGTYWCSHVGGRRIDTADKESIGDTPLVAAMRAFVTAKLGAEVDL